jgi:hypothetical protein
MTKLTPAGFSLVALLAGCSADGINPSGSGVDDEKPYLIGGNCEGGLDFSDENVGIDNFDLLCEPYGTPADSEMVFAGIYDSSSNTVRFDDPINMVCNNPEYQEESEESWNRLVRGTWQFDDNWDYTTTDDEYYSFQIGGANYGDILNEVIDEFNIVAMWPIDTLPESDAPSWFSSTHPRLYLPSSDSWDGQNHCSALQMLPVGEYICDRYPDDNYCSILDSNEAPVLFWW